MNKKGILIITLGFRPNIGGLETHLDDLCEHLRKKEYNVCVITYQPLTTRVRAPRIERKENLEIHRIRRFNHNWFYKLEPFPLLEFLYLFPPLMVSSFFFLLKNRERIDVIHSQGLICGVAGIILAKFFRKRSVFSTHSIYQFKRHSLMSRFTRRVLSSFDRILCISRQSKKELTSMGIDENKTEVFTYWVDQTIFSPRDKKECKKKLGWQNEFVILFVGRLLETKGVRLLLEGAKRFEKSNSNISFAFIGNGPLEKEVEKASKENRKIISIGRVDNKNLSLYYNTADVVIVPSLHEEGLGRVILESLSCGTPVIASRRGGIPEVVDDSVGLLIEPKIDEIVKSVKYLYNYPQELKRLASNCRKYAQRRFSQSNAKGIEESYG